MLAAVVSIATLAAGLVGAPRAVAVPAAPRIATVASGWQHNCALTTGGAVWCWGANDAGQLGDGTTIDRATPVPVAGLSSGVVKIAAGARRSCAVVAGVDVVAFGDTGHDILKCWGDNSTGALGDGTTENRSVPTEVSGLSSVKDVALGAYHTCALGKPVTMSGLIDRARVLSCWGQNDQGQLGDGTTANIPRPTPAGITDVEGVTAGDGHTCASIARNSGGFGAKCWGDNAFGQLGDGTAVDRATPVDVSGLAAEGIDYIVAGGQHTCFRTREPIFPRIAFKCFGRNNVGQLGDGSTTDRLAPVTVKRPVPTWEQNPISISTGRWHSCALMGGPQPDRTWCWGSLEPSGVIPQSLPVRIPGLSSGVVEFTPLTLGAGDGHTCVIVLGGRVECFGTNSHGQLGNGTTTDSSAPVVVDFPGLALAEADFNGDAKTDVAVFRPSSSTWFAVDYNGSAQITAWGTDGDIAVVGEYDDDGRSDVAVFRPSDGSWYVKGSAGVDTFTHWGTNGDIPVPADYDGDLKTDMAVYRPSSATWFVLDGITTQFGDQGDIPVPGDYDADGTADIAMFRPSTGTWHFESGEATAWGTVGDIPVPGDYDGNGTTDIAVFRPSSGTWFVRGGITTNWGANGDVPVPGDYDANGTSDIAVFRPSSGTWFVQGGDTTNWGTRGDQPLALPSYIHQSLQ